MKLIEEPRYIFSKEPGYKAREGFCVKVAAIELPFVAILDCMQYGKILPNKGI